MGAGNKEREQDKKKKQRRRKHKPKGKRATHLPQQDRVDGDLYQPAEQEGQAADSPDSDPIASSDEAVFRKAFGKGIFLGHRSSSAEAELEYQLLFFDGQHTSWIGKSLLVSMGYAGEMEQYHNQEMKEEVFFEAKDDDIPAWFDHNASE